MTSADHLIELESKRVDVRARREKLVIMRRAARTPDLVRDLDAQLAAVGADLKAMNIEISALQADAAKDRRARGLAEHEANQARATMNSATGSHFVDVGELIKVARRTRDLLWTSTAKKGKGVGVVLPLSLVDRDDLIDRITAALREG